MFELTFLFVGAVASASSYLTISRRIDEVLGGVFSAMWWTVWALYANDVTIVDNGTKISEGYTPLFFLGVGAGLIMFLFLIRAITGSLNPRDDTRFGDNNDLSQ